MNRLAQPRTIGACLDDLTVRLRKTSETPALDAQVLLAHVLGAERPWILAHPESPVGGPSAAALEALARQLESGQRLPYVLGSWEFFGLEWEITPEVLIPRPETELLVEKALGWLRSHPAQRRAADVGTGSGCIAISLAASIPDLTVLATDLSPQALQVARRNAVRHHVEKRVELVCSDLIPPGERGFHLIAANLPYIPTRKLQSLPIYGHEPSLALDGGVDGLDLIRRLIEISPERLASGGLLLLEIEASQGPAVLSMACDVFEDGQIHLHQDLSGRDRLLEVRV